MNHRAPQSSKSVSATLAFFFGIVGADFFYRREFVSGVAVFGVLIAGYALSPLIQGSVAGLLRQIPVLLVLYGWVRAFIYYQSKGL